MARDMFDMFKCENGKPWSEEKKLAVTQAHGGGS
jgi:hypothetical protein